MGLLSKAISIQVFTGRSGGLLRKLTVYSARLSGEQVSGAASTPSRQGGGLLQKSMLFLKLEEEDKESESLLILGDAVQIGRLLDRIEHLTKDFTYFPGLYSLLIKDFHLPRSAFFLYNGLRRCFTPWLSRGLDPALSHALEFSEDQWRRTLSPSFGLESARSLFPSLGRELPQPLYHFPFVHQGTLEGSLLVSNFALHPQYRDSIESLFKNLSRKVGATIAQITKTLSGLAIPGTVFATPEAALPALLESGSARPDTFLVLQLPLDPLFQILSGRDGYFDRFRFREIVLFVVNSYFSHLGVAVPQGEKNIVVILRASHYFSRELFLATLSQLISDVFQGLFRDRPALAAARVFEYPACGLKPLEIAAAL
jgi:hypothetical protein